MLGVYTPASTVPPAFAPRTARAVVTRTPARPADRPPFECRVRFPARLLNARLGHPTAPLPPAPARRTAVPPPPPSEPAPAPVSPTPHSELRTPHAPELVAALGRVAEAVGTLRQEQAGRLQEWQRAAVELAAAMATRVLHERVGAGDFPMEAKVRDMVAELEADAPATVYLHPADLAALEIRLAGGELTPGRDAPKLLPDPALGRGDCRVESREAVLLSEITRELQDIRDDLFRSFGNARS